MRTCLIVLAAVASLPACKKSPSTGGGGGDGAAQHSTKDADALWALAPDKTRMGIVITPRALDLFESGALTAQQLLDKPDMAFIKAKVVDAITGKLGGPFKSFADLGIDKSHGLAYFMTDEAGPFLALPVGDRAKLSKLTGMDLGTDPGKLGPLVCKPVNNVSLCAMKAESLAQLGKASLPAALKAIGARGDIETIANQGALSGAGVVQLERGEMTVRGTLQGAPPTVSSKLGTPNKVRSDDHTVAFAVANIAPLADLVPAGFPLPGGGTLGDLLKSVNGPITVTISAGSIAPDTRIPLSDPAPAKSLIDHCKDIIPAAMLAATQEPGVCKFNIPQYAMELEMWVDANMLHVGQRKPPAPKPVALSPLGKELAAGSWAVALWGRGTLFGSTGLPGFSADLPEEGTMMIRAMTLLSEMGIGARVDGDKLSFVAGFRTLYANPPDVIEKLLAIPPNDVAGGKVDAAQAIGKAAPTSPFAGDLAAGQGGLMVPTAAIGMLAAVAIPAFMDYMKKSKKTEAALQLNKLGKNLKVVYAETAAFPVGEVALTPAESCCKGPNARCQPTPDEWANPVWQQLDFQIDEPHLFRYSFKSDGKSVTATAVGDLDCDGTEVTYSLAVTVSPDGVPAAVLTEPPPNSD